MPISMLFKFRLVIFYNRHVLSTKNNHNLTEKDHQILLKQSKLSLKKENGQCFSLLLTYTVSLLGTFGTSPVGCSGNSWRLACGSWMLGTANCLNGAVITLVSNYLIGSPSLASLFLFLVSLNWVNFYHCNEKNKKSEKKKIDKVEVFLTNEWVTGGVGWKLWRLLLVKAWDHSQRFMMMRFFHFELNDSITC